MLDTLFLAMHVKPLLHNLPINKLLQKVHSIVQNNIGIFQNRYDIEESKEWVEEKDIFIKLLGDFGFENVSADDDDGCFFVKRDSLKYPKRYLIPLNEEVNTKIFTVIDDIFSNIEDEMD